MLRALKDFFRTLKMELGVIEVKKFEPRFQTRVRSDFSFLSDPEVRKGSLDIVVRELNLENSAVDVKSVDFRSSDVNVLTGNVTDEELILRSEDFSYVRNSIHDLSDFDIKTHLESIEFHDEVEVLKHPVLKTSVRDGMNVEDIWTVRIERSEYFPKDVVLNVLERILSEYKGDPRNLRFLGFYRSVPLGYASKLSLMGRDLVIHLKRNGRKTCVNLIALKIGEKIKLEVVGKC